MQVIRLTDAFATFTELWSPRIVAELNGQQVKVVKMRGEFPWHDHPTEDEMFLVLQGELRLDYRDKAGSVQTAIINAGELIVVPRGTPHRPFAPLETEVLLFEPASTLNTGNTRNEYTVDDPVKLI